MRRFAKSLKADMSSEGSNPSLSAYGDCSTIGSAGDCDSPRCGFKSRQTPLMVRSTTVVHPAVNGTVEGSNPSEPVPLLCNGSTGDFDSSSLGSNPSEGMPS